MPTLAASDIYPAVRNFLLDCGLAKTLKAFDKEIAVDEEAEVPSTKKAKLIAKLELLEACQEWANSRPEAKKRKASESATNGVEVNSKKKAAPAEVEEEAEAVEEEVAVEEQPAKKKKKKASVSEQPVAPEAEVEEEAQEQPAKKKKKKASVSEQPIAPAAEAEQEAEAAVEEAVEKEAKPVGKKGKKEKAERKAGTPFQRIDDSWLQKIKDDRLRDNTHQAKDKFGDSVGDSWGDKAAGDLIKVKGKGFRKEMAKKKRASWRGGGEIDQGVNSIKFDDDSDEE